MKGQDGPRRVAFIAGTLGQGGAEKQLVYMASALQASEIECRVYCLRRGEHFEAVLRSKGIPVVHVGSNVAPPLRLARIIREVRSFRPNIVQASHFYTNLYAALAARACGVPSVGAVRSDGCKDIQDVRPWSGWLLRAPTILVVNSTSARSRVVAMGLHPAKVRLIPNVWDARSVPEPVRRTGDAVARDHDAAPILAIGSLTRAKRFDRFLRALAQARVSHPSLHALIAGDGPERSPLEHEAARLGLLEHGVRFLGHVPDVPALLTLGQMLVLTSDHEGFPNVVLEAMGAGLPVVTTPAGDAGKVVVEGQTGYVVGFDDVAALAQRIMLLATSPALRAQLGDAGRRRALTTFSPRGLATQLRAAYREAGRRLRASPWQPGGSAQSQSASDEPGWSA